MFKRVEDDVLLGVSKVITRNNYDTGNLLIDEDNASEKLKLSIENDVNSESDSEEILDESKLSEDKFVSQDNTSEKDEENSSDDINKKYIPIELVHRDEYNEMKEELLSSLKEHINYLKEQIDTKDKQLQNKDELIRNFQVLMKSDKERIHELESGEIEDEKVDINSELDVEIEESLSNDKTTIEATIDIDTNEVKTKKRGLLGWFRKQI